MFAQNPDYTQSNTNLLYTNPSFAGMQQCPHLYTSYRAKHVEIEGGYVSSFASFDGYISSLDGDVAVTILHDVQQNSLYSTGAMVVYAKEYKLKKETCQVSTGLTGHYRLDFCSSIGFEQDIHSYSASSEQSPHSSSAVSRASGNIF